jgi:hypothetical protein
MATMLDYLYWRGDVPFSCSPFNDVDNLILSEFSYLLLEKALPEGGQMTVRALHDALKDCPDAFGFISQESNRKMLAFMGEGRRFCDAEVCFYLHETDAEIQKQFAAMTFLLPDGTAFIAFRGTDNTLVGWKEDFNMAFSCPVPAQVEALVYLLRAADLFPLPIRVGGHSKGGNLAVYAAAYAPAEIQDHILAVYSNDGPGMDDVTFQSLGYIQIVPRLRSIVPEFSVIGMLLHQHQKYQVVKSSASGLSQHDPFSWCVQREDFEDAGHLKAASIKMDEILDTWLFDMSTDDRMALIDTLYAVLNATKALTVEDLGCCKLKNAGAILSVLRHMDGSSRHLVWEKLGGLVSVAVGGGKAEQEKAEPAVS